MNLLNNWIHKNYNGWSLGIAQAKYVRHGTLKGTGSSTIPTHRLIFWRFCGRILSVQWTFSWSQYRTFTFRLLHEDITLFCLKKNILEYKFGFQLHILITVSAKSVWLSRSSSCNRCTGIILYYFITYITCEIQSRWLSVVVYSSACLKLVFNWGCLLPVYFGSL